MADRLSFMMGQYEAVVPTDRLYSENHHWLQESAGGFRVGLTAYSVRLLQDVFFLEWHVDPGTAAAKKQELGEIESSKAVSSLAAPADGTLVRFNDALLNDPSAINSDGYGAGWLYDFDTQTRFLSAQQYVELLESTWEDTQRMIKGQIN